MSSKIIELATYATWNYRYLLECCILGCQRVWGISPVVYTDSEGIATLAKNIGCEYRKIVMHPYSQVTALQILRNSCADCLLMIDADCWPLTMTPLEAVLANMDDAECAFSGHIGNLDIPYLFRGSMNEPFSSLRSLLQKYPRFAQRWVNAESANGGFLNTGCVVNLPLLYGGFAGYCPKHFSNLEIPDWIYSGDIWLSIYAIENELTIHHTENWHFNQNLDADIGICHWIGKGLGYEYPINEYLSRIGV
ncbi:hypothetical protein FACS1894158_02580 [Betaproteobacteria bacterium]|nr:hypothetical protein FACS1894158_02580 [Betaproteobacteria bacterium]